MYWMSVFSTMAIKPLGLYFHTKCIVSAIDLMIKKKKSLVYTSRYNSVKYLHDKRKKNRTLLLNTTLLNIQLTLNLSNYHWWKLRGIKIRNKSLLWQIPTALHLLRRNGDKLQTNRAWNQSTAEAMFEKPRWGVNGVWSMNVQHNNDAQLPRLLLPTDGLLKDQ